MPFMPLWLRISFIGLSTSTYTSSKKRMWARFTAGRLSGSCMVSMRNLIDSRLCVS